MKRAFGAMAIVCSLLLFWGQTDLMCRASQKAPGEAPVDFAKVLVTVAVDDAFQDVWKKCRPFGPGIGSGPSFWVAEADKNFVMFFFDVKTLKLMNIVRYSTGADGKSTGVYVLPKEKAGQKVEN